MGAGSWTYTRRSIGRKNHHFRADSGQLGKLCLLKKMLRKSLPSYLDVLHCCSLFNVLRFSFSLNLLAGYTVSGYDVTMLTLLPAVP